MLANLQDYKKLKEEKEKYLKSVGKWKCFFSGELLANEVVIDWHHLGGRKGKKDDIPLLIYEPYLWPAKHKYHQEWHDLPLSKLKDKHWWQQFLINLEHYAPELYERLTLKL